MPRNSTGNYTLPLPPVVSGELIEATWANTTLDDIGQAITDSLDRYGRGGMLASFLFADGTVSNPGAAWANAPGTGFYRDSTHLGFTWNGAEVLGYNANGLTGKIESVNVAGMFNIDKTGSLSFDGDSGAPLWYIGRASGDRFTLFNAVTSIESFSVNPTTDIVSFSTGLRVTQGAAVGWLSNEGTDAWRMDVDGAENLYLFNVGLAKSVITYQVDGSTVMNGGALVAQQGTTFNFRNIGNTSNAWVMGAADFYGNDTFGIYNAVMGTWFLTVNPTLNYAEFTNSVRAPYLDTPNTSTGDLVTITAAGDPSVRFVKNGLSDSTISATSNGHLSVAVNGSYVATFQNDGNLRANSAFYANGPIFAGVVDSNVEKNIGFTGNQGVSAPYFYFNGDATGVGLYWALVGILWRYDRVSGNVSFDSPVSVRAKQFVASSVP